MFIVLGATGHVGSVVTRELLAAGEPVTAVTRDASRAEPLRAQGAAVAVVDVRDADALRAVLRQGRRAFLLNPPADPAGDPDEEERATVRSLLAALDGSGLEGIVAQSTYGAQPGRGIGDLGVLWELEEGLHGQPVPAAVMRAAYLMSNWDGLVDAARAGVLPSVIPADLAIPMVAPQDLGRAAARLLREPPGRAGVYHVEGPERRSPADVAAAFAAALGRPVEPEVTPREGWVEMFQGLGFSEAAARSYAGMTAITVDRAYELPDDPERGTVTIDQYVQSLGSE